MSYSMDKRQAKGTALYTRKLLENILDDCRFEFYLVHYEKNDDPLYGRADEILMPLVKLPYASHFISQLLFFWQYRKRKFDIIHWFQPRVYPFFWLAPAKKIVVTTHGAGDITAPGKWIFSRKVFNLVLAGFNKKVDAFIAVSKYGVEEIRQHYHAIPQNIYFTYNGGGENFKVISKIEARQIISDKYGAGQPFILGLARHLPHKNITGLVRAYKILRDSFARSEKLIIAGTPDSDTKMIIKLAGESGYKDDIIFIDYIKTEDLNAFYSAAELFVFPSLQEGFGLPIIEAMASGVPVITSSLTSMPEIAGDAALLVNPHNPQEIAEKMNEVLSDMVLKEKLIQAGIARAELFSWKITSEETKEIYIKLLS